MTKTTIKQCTSLELALQKMVPKPSKRDVIKAAAAALYAKRKAAYDEAKVKVEAAQKKLEAKLRKLVKVPLGVQVDFDCKTCGWQGYPSKYKLTVSVPEHFDGSLTQLQEAKDAAEKAAGPKPDFDKLYKQLCEAAVGPSPTVDAMLADPVLKAHLVKAAEQVLVGGGKAIEV